MKKTYIYYSFLILFALLSCKKEIDFENNDNYISTFSIVNQSEIYIGNIINDTIYLNIPNDIDIKEFKACIETSPDVSISPDPTIVKDWEQQNSINITSESGIEHIYQIKINRRNQKDIFLTTQEEVDKFASIDISTIEGNLIIGRSFGNDSITDLSALKNIKKITYNLTINPTYNGNSLSTLENLTSVGGLIITEGNNNLETVDVPNLIYIKSDLIINKCDNISSINIQKLKSIGNNLIITNSKNITSINAPSLTIVSNNIIITQCNRLNEIILSKLNRVYNDLKIEWCRTLENLEIQSIEHIGKSLSLDNLNIDNISLQNLNTVSESVKIRQCGNLKELILPKFKSPNCNVEIEYNDLIKTIRIPEIEEINNLLIVNSKNLTKLEIPKISVVNGNLKLYSLNELPDISTFANLSYVGKEVSIEYLYKIKNIRIPELSTVGKSFTLDYCLNVEECCFSKLSIINGNFRLYKLEKLKSLMGFQNIKEITGKCELMLLKNITNLSGLKSLEKIGKKLDIYKNNNIQDLNIPKLKTIGGLTIMCADLLTSTSSLNQNTIINGDIRIAHNPNMTYISIPKINTTINGDLQLDHLPKVIDLDMFSSVNKISGNLNVSELSLIKNLKGFSSLTGKIKNFYLNSCSEITEIKAFSSIKEFSSISIYCNEKLSNYEGFSSNALQNIAQLNIDYNAYNPTLEELKQGKFTK